MENHSGKEGFAVIGMACRFPQANSVEEYWNILENGLNTSSSLPPDRLQLTPINPQAKGNFLKCSVDQFDASFFEPPIADTELDIQQFKNEFISNIITISGKNSKALNQATVLLENFLKESKENLGDIAYSANACRTHHQFRRILIGIEKLEILTKIHNENWKTGSVRKEKPKICFTFSGLVGDINFEPAKILYDTCPTFRMQMDHCNTISCEVVIVSIMEIMAGKLNRPATAKEFYFFSLSVQLSLSKLWENWGIKPNAVMGHSVGEISAAVVSGVIDFGAALKMLNKMIIPPEGANPSTFMMAINASPDLTTELLNEFKEKECNQRNWVEISARNSKFQTVVTGKIGGFQGFKKFCEEKGVKCKNLNYGAFGFPLHSTAMKEYLPTGWNIGDQHQPPNITYISSVTGTQLEKLPINYWQELFISPVNYISACKASKDGGSNVYLEIGLGRPLTKLTEENIIQDSNTMFLSSLTGKGEKIWEGLLNTLGSLHVEGIQINWDNFYEHASKRKVSLPHYPFQRQSYWFKKNPNSQNSQGIHSKNNSNPKDHPLLGCYLPLAGGFSSEVTIFQNEMSSIDPYFLKDHCIGNSVIFPAAAFLEMILSAGKLTKTNEKQNISNDNHISVEDFIVHSPLHLKQEGNLIFQTIVEKASSQISVYSSYPSKSNLKSSWTLQASATIKIEKNERPIPADPPKKLELDVDFDAEEVVKFYDRHSKLGLNFGTEFRSLKKVLFGNDDELIALVNLPEQEEKKKEYLIHPILLDSMIQSFLFHSNPNFGKLRVPVRIKNICVFTRIESKTQNDIPLFLHCKADELTSQTTQVSLIDGNGNLLCIMRNPEFVATSVNAILRAAGVEERDQNEKGMPNLYKILWKKSNYLSNKSLKMDSFGPQTKNLWLVLQNGENNLIENLFSKIETVVENIKVISQVVDDNQKIEPILEQNKRNLEHIFYVVTSKQMENQDQRSFLEPLLNILQFLLKSKLPTLPKLYVVTSNAWNIGDERKFLEITPSSASLWGFVRSARLEIPGLQTKLIDLENFNELSEYAANQLLQEVLVNDKESEVAYRNENRFVRRMEELSHKNKNSLVSFPLSERFIVEVPKRKSINWGQWDAGMGEGLQLQFARAFPIHQGISTLQKLFEENQTSMVAGNVNFSWLTRTFPNYETTLLENISWREEKEEGNEGGEITKIPVQQKKFFIETYNALQNESDKMEAIEKFVARIVKDTLGLRDCETIERNRLFSEMGMDSIMSIEFLNRLKADVYHEFLLGFVHMEESGTVDQISQLLNNRLSSQRI
ncbi:unnamed protein product [Orchesella dallaii]|uniref:Uncharacterized protein n=1 Tax=Orchesella dallaii TaxID=48710 RepID=A0ABP1RV86_9HEXA